jgi:hypothetical protein
MSTDQQYATWKNISMFLSGIVVSLIVMWATYVRSAVSRDEMENYVTQRISTMDKQIAELNKNVIELKEATAGLKAELAARAAKR